eukprot:scaffold140468_cov43-Prasinocladus_malaysianus.AAC.1
MNLLCTRGQDWEKNAEALKLFGYTVGESEMTLYARVGLKPAPAAAGVILGKRGSFESSGSVLPKESDNISSQPASIPLQHPPVASQEKRLKDLLRARLIAHIPRNGKNQIIGKSSMFPKAFKMVAVAEGLAFVKEFDRQHGTSMHEIFNVVKLKKMLKEYGVAVCILRLILSNLGG